MIKIRDLTFEYFDRDDEGNLTEMVNAIRGINFDAGEVNKVLFDDKPAKEGVKDLMVREKRVEHLNLKWEN